MIGCAERGTVREPVTRQLPPAPSYLEPQPIPPRVLGQDPRKDAANIRGIARVQNTIITSTKKWYGKIRQVYSTPAK